ncbi:uncharacterized protein METZ01_LOCUS292550 [marine metagenome]|uniref:Phytanoyl-CoA dioxygenase n=1 Tax=marine metagenome TaxID=408172 RepID=A0A382LT21_9ZZZZ
MHKDWKALKRAFVDDGFINLSSWLDEDLVQRVLTDSLEYKGISIFERESVGDLLCHPQILEFVEFLLEVDTDQVAISPFRFWNHLSAGGVSDGGGWHVDDTYMAHRPLTELLCMYYPQKVTEDMGPTMLLPGSHRRLYTPSQTNKLGWIKGQQKVIVEAGTLVIAYASILHAKAAHFSDVPRSMVKYGYEIGDSKYGYYLTQEAYDNFRRTGLGCSLTQYAEVKDKKDAVWSSYWKFHDSYTFQDFKHQIGVVGRELRKRLEHETTPEG